MSKPYRFNHEYFRVFSVYEVTEEATFGEGETPESLISSMIKVEVVHVIGLISSDGVMTVNKYYLEPPKDKSKNDMGAVILEGVEIIPARDGGQNIKSEVRFNDRLPEELKAKGDEMKEVILTLTGTLPTYG